MIEERIGYRYAKSIFDLSLEKGIANSVKNDMELLRETCQGNRELQTFLGSPIIHKDKKQSVLDAIFKGKFESDLMPLLLSTTIRKGREKYLYHIATAFAKLYDTEFKIDRGVLTSAEALDSETVAQIKAVIEQKTGRTFILEEKVDESLIGGFVLTIGDKLFDGSIATSLRKLRNDYDDNLYIKLY
ncbi:MAG: ATP synthase F1 subunit delta [Bacteroidia bacterium]